MFYQNNTILPNIHRPHTKYNSGNHNNLDIPKKVLHLPNTYHMYNIDKMNMSPVKDADDDDYANHILSKKKQICKRKITFSYSSYELMPSGTKTSFKSRSELLCFIKIPS